MAEYASALIGLVAFAVNTCRIVDDLVHSLQDANIDFLALKSEVSDFQNMVDKVSIAHSARQGPAAMDYDGRLAVMKQCRQALGDVDGFIRAVQRNQRTGDQQVRRLAWVRYSKKCTKLTARLRMLKASLSTIVIIETASVFLVTL